MIGRKQMNIERPTSNVQLSSLLRESVRVRQFGGSTATERRGYKDKGSWYSLRSVGSAQSPELRPSGVGTTRRHLLREYDCSVSSNSAPVLPAHLDSAKRTQIAGRRNRT